MTAALGLPFGLRPGGQTTEVTSSHCLRSSYRRDSVLLLGRCRRIIVMTTISWRARHGQAPGLAIDSQLRQDY